MIKNIDRSDGAGYLLEDEFHPPIPQETNLNSLSVFLSGHVPLTGTAGTTFAKNDSSTASTKYGNYSRPSHSSGEEILT